MTQTTNNQPTPPPPPPIRKLQTKTTSKAVGQKRPETRVTASRVKKKRYHDKRRKIRRELSAGGVAARLERGQWLVALLKTEHRKGEVWVLPKGHVELDKKERVSDAAKREVQEEAGLQDLSIKDQLGVTRFTFQAEDALVRKTVHYYLMTTGQKTLHPQEEEGLLEASWFPIDMAIQALEYDTDQEIVAKAKEKLTGEKTRLPKKVQQRRRRSIRVHA